MPKSKNAKRVKGDVKNGKHIIFDERPVRIVDNKTTPLHYAEYMIKEYQKEGKDDAFYIMDIGEVLREHAGWCEMLPRVKPYYAVKCNPDSVLLAVLAHLGCSYDCASMEEFEGILKLKVTPDRIIYANPCKTPSYIKDAKKCGVKLMTFDDESELDKIHKLYPDAELVLRITACDSTASSQLSMKFGCDPEKVAPKLLRDAAKMGLKIVGMSFHVGSGGHDPSAYGKAIENCHRLFEIGRECGHEMRLLDIGGGWPGNTDNEKTFGKYATAVNEALDKYFPEDKCKDVRIIGEPGTFYATSPYTLCVNVIAVKEVQASRITEKEADSGQSGYMYYINDGVYGSFNCPVFDKTVPDPVPFVKHTDKKYWSSIWGPTCDNRDCVIKKIELPKLEEEDWMGFQNMGAYTMAASSRFNGFECPDVHYFIHEDSVSFLTTHHNKDASLKFEDNA